MQDTACPLSRCEQEHAERQGYRWRRTDGSWPRQPQKAAYAFWPEKQNESKSTDSAFRLSATAPPTAVRTAAGSSRPEVQMLKARRPDCLIRAFRRWKPEFRAAGRENSGAGGEEMQRCAMKNQAQQRGKAGAAARKDGRKGDRKGALRGIPQPDGGAGNNGTPCQTVSIPPPGATPSAASCAAIASRAVSLSAHRRNGLHPARSAPPEYGHKRERGTRKSGIRESCDLPTDTLTNGQQHVRPTVIFSSRPPLFSGLHPT